jgi:hypothetical protein
MGYDEISAKEPVVEHPKARLSEIRMEALQCLEDQLRTMPTGGATEESSCSTAGLTFTPKKFHLAPLSLPLSILRSYRSA